LSERTAFLIPSDVTKSTLQRERAKLRLPERLRSLEFSGSSNIKRD